MPSPCDLKSTGEHPLPLPGESPSPLSCGRGTFPWGWTLYPHSQFKSRGPFALLEYHAQRMVLEGHTALLSGADERKRTDLLCSLADKGGALTGASGSPGNPGCGQRGYTLHPCTQVRSPRSPRSRQPQRGLNTRSIRPILGPGTSLHKSESSKH